MGRHARINHVREHVLVITDFKFLGERIEAKSLHELDDSIVPPFEIGNAIFSGHGNGSRGVFACAIFAQESFEGGPDVFLFLNLHGLEV